MDEFNDVLIKLPEFDANLKLPDPNLRDFYLDEKERIFWISDNIDDETLSLVRMIIMCNKEDKDIDVEKRKPITVMINSNGGAVDVLFTIIKTIEISKTPVRTVCYCGAYSAAADLLASGHKGMRYCLPGTSIMMHAGSCSYQGTQSQVEAAKKFYDNMGKKITDYVMAHTEIDQKTAKKMKDDYYMTEEDALSLGIIDKIIEDLDEIF